MHKVAKREKRNISPTGALHCWYEERKPFLIYTGKFTGFLFIACLLSLTPVYQGLLKQEAVGTAKLAQGMISQFKGESSSLSDTTLFRGQEAILEVKTKCSGLSFCWLLAAAVLAFPAPWGWRLAGVAVGSGILLCMNLLRVASLFLVGCHYPGWFQAVHEQFWPVLSLMVTSALAGAWFLGMRKMTR